ncbi:MAG: phage tail tape measure protein [Sulfurimonas sp. RIFOXYD12_FULL_33_39]|uniref:phage tail tape measure protein n=1 Tax=unclassified Sulfurimonas TaxID=2623549 RepID=UPI0008D0FC6A|nr:MULTISPECIES: phage tail tape measure protein [unclassified Sulfurimonas]OHE09519.1 MAG: phage tail tape measure protein [Sulfurimonas sp. RIFOXYD12_FULL_33_39]OHE12700.1 MAG: phage tail tape measure protein [Sulfurimonas sp. RIFOXYD2_FULL_34_21]
MSLKAMGLGIVIGAAVSSSFKSSIGTAINSIGGLKEKINGLNSQRVELRKMDTESSKIELRKVNAELLKLKKDAIIHLKFETKKEELLAQKNAILGVLGTAMVIRAPIMAQMQVEQAQGEISSLGINEAGIQKITKAGREFSNQFAGTTTSDFIKASYDIKSGIASLSDEGVAKFTSLAAMTATATKASTSEMTKLFALGYGIYRDQFKSDFDFGEKFSAAISTSVMAFRTDGVDLSTGLSTLGAVATKFGVSLSEQLSIIGNAKGAFNSASEAATSYRAFLMNVGKAQEKLGVQMTDSQGKMLPMSQILESLKDKFGDLEKVENMDKLKEAFGSDEAVKIVTALIDKTKDLTASQKQINDEMEKGTSITKQMADAMQRGKGFELLGQQIGNLGASIGKIFMPAATLLASGIGVMVNGVDGFINTFPVLSSVIGGVAMGFFGLVAVIKIATITKTLFQMATIVLRGSLLAQIPVVNGLRLAFNRLSLTKMLTSAKTGVLTAMQWAYNTAATVGSGASLKFGAALRFVGSGIAWIGLAVLAIAGAAYAIYTYWEPIKGFFSSVWNSVLSIFGAAKDGIKMALSFSPIGLIAMHWEPIRGFFVWVWNSVLSVFGQAWTAITGVLGFNPIGIVMQSWEGIKTYFINLWQGLVAGFVKTFEKVGEMWGSVKSFLGFGDDKDTKKTVKLTNNTQNIGSEVFKKDVKVTESKTVAPVIKPIAVSDKGYQAPQPKPIALSESRKQSIKPVNNTEVSAGGGSSAAKKTAAAVMIGGSLVAAPQSMPASTVMPKTHIAPATQTAKESKSPQQYKIDVTFTGDIIVKATDGKVVEAGQLKSNLEDQVRVALSRIKDSAKNRSFEDEVI